MEDEDKLKKAQANLFALFKEIDPTLKPQDVRLEFHRLSSEFNETLSKRMLAGAVDETQFVAHSQLYWRTPLGNQIILIDLSAASNLHPHLEKITETLHNATNTWVTYSGDGLKFFGDVDTLASLTPIQKKQLTMAFKEIARQSTVPTP